MNNRSYKIIWNKERQQYVVKSPSNAKTFARTALAAATVIGIMSSSVGVVSAATAITDTTSRTVSSNGSPVYVETKTTGNKEIEIGETATAEGVNNIAIGNGSQTTGNESVAIGGSTKAQGNQSTAVGYSSTAYGENSIALGMGAITGVKDQLGKVVNSSGDSGQYGENAVAIGAKANAQSTASVAIGANTVAISDTVSNFTSITKRPITVIGTDAIIDGGNKGSNGSTAIGGNSLAGLLYRVKGDTDTNFKDKVSFTEKDYDTASGGLIAIQGDTNPPDHSNNLFALAGIDTKKATIDVNEATAIGFDARALGDQSIAIGAQTVAGHSSVAIGGNDMNSVSSTAKNAYKDNVGKAFPTNSTSGFYPTTSALDGSVAIGQKAASYASLGTAIGTAAEVKSTATLGTAIGIGAQTGNGKEDNDAIGATAIGAGAYANARHATAIAIGSQALGVNSVATGYKSNASGVDSVAIGREAKASGTQSISIGTSNSVSGNYSGAVGDPSIIEGTGSYTVGNDNAVGATSTNVGAFGNNNQIGATATYDSNGKLQATAIYDSNGDLQRISGLVTKAAVDSSKVVGNNNYVNTSGTYVLGSGIGVKSDKSVMDTVANSVYLGDNSQVLATAGANMDVDGVAGSTTTGGATGSVSTATVKSKDAATTLTYGGFAGEKAVGAVSVGAAGSERRIQNVAAGEISATSTDAINGSQLYAANQVTANVAGSVA
uniref:YadA family autotransporter adhesin n=1 Tax=Veillonella caviae TaxID=248316 RepID=UPI003C6F1554